VRSGQSTAVTPCRFQVPTAAVREMQDILPRSGCEKSKNMWLLGPSQSFVFNFFNAGIM
jgi:hypothetical protein